MDHRNWQQTRDILICIICIGIIFWALWSVLGLFVDAIVVTLLSLAVAFLLSPLVNFLVRYGCPRLLATAVTYVVVLGILGWLGYALVSSLIQQLSTFASTVTSIAQSLPDTLRSTIDFLETQGHIPDQNIQNAIGQVQSAAGDFARTLPNNIVVIIQALTNTFLDIFLIGVIGFYLTLDGKRIRNSLIGVAPKRWLPNVLLFEDALNRVVGNYIRGQLTLALIVGLCTAFICVVNPPLGQYALICGVMAFLFETIPMVGPALASITPILLSLLLPGPFPRTLIVVALFVLLQVLESNILGPRIVGHAVGLHPVAAILALIVGAQLFGVFGALLATPIVAAIWVVVASLYRSARGETADQILARRRTPWQIRRPPAAPFERIRSGPPSREQWRVGQLVRARARVKTAERLEEAAQEEHTEAAEAAAEAEGVQKPGEKEPTNLIYSNEKKEER